MYTSIYNELRYYIESVPLPFQRNLQNRSKLIRLFPKFILIKSLLITDVYEFHFYMFISREHYLNR